jgi:Domain of unknown function DUF11/PASTA domain
MGLRAGLLPATLAVLAVSSPPTAGAVTIGAVTSTPIENLCEVATEPVVFIQAGSAGQAYVVPTGGGLITSWQTSFGSSGAPLEMVIARPTQTVGLYTIVGSDKETLPAPIPANNVSTFLLSTPLAVHAGDLLGIAIPGSSATACAYPGSVGDTVLYALSGLPDSGEALQTSHEDPKTLLNIAAELSQTVDLSLTESITPASGGPGVALISLTPGGPGPGGVAATVTDVLPAGLTVLAAAVSEPGACSVAGQTVTCSLSEVTLGTAPAVVDVVVSSATPGSYTNQALLTPALSDSNPANNAASATLTVTAPNPPAKCTVIALKGAKPALAEAALKALHCHIGRVKRVSSKTVHKGLVVSTSLKPGTTAAANTPVGINVSSGKPKKKKHH